MDYNATVVNSRSSGQETVSSLCNPKLHCSVDNSSPLVSMRSQINSFHTFVSYFLKVQICCNVTLPSIPTPCSSKLSLSIGFSDQISVCSYFFSCRCCISSFLVYLPIFVAKSKKWLPQHKANRANCETIPSVVITVCFLGFRQEETFLFVIK